MKLLYYENLEPYGMYLENFIPKKLERGNHQNFVPQKFPAIATVTTYIHKTS